MSGPDAGRVRLDPVPRLQEGISYNEDGQDQQPMSSQVAAPTHHVSRFLGFIPSALRCRIGANGDYSRKLPRLPSVAKRRKQGSSKVFRDRVEDNANVPVKNSHATVEASPEVCVHACSGWYCKPIENRAAGPVEGRCADTLLSITSPDVAIEPLVPTAGRFPAKTQALGISCGKKHTVYYEQRN